MSTDDAFEGAFLNQDPRSMINLSKIWITRPAVDRALVLECKYMLTGKGSMLSSCQCLQLGGLEVPEALLLPDGRVPQIPSTTGLEVLCIKAASSPTVLLTPMRTGGIAVVKLTSSRVDSPPWGVTDREPPSHNDRADVIVSRARGV